MPLWRGVVALALAAPVRGASLRQGEKKPTDGDARPKKEELKSLLKPGQPYFKDVRNEKPMVYFIRDASFWKKTEEFKNSKFDQNLHPAHDLGEAAEYVIGQHEVLKGWVTGLMGVLSEKADDELRECCAKGNEWSVLPHSHYGKATEEQIQWWKDNKCDVIVGAAEADMVVGLPKCETSRAVTAIVTKPTSEQIVMLDQQMQTPNCSESDRRNIDDTYHDRETKSMPLANQCIPPNIVVPNEFKKEVLTDCLKDMLHVESRGCSECYSNLVDDMMSNCFESCVRLMDYGMVQTIKETGMTCTKCLWPQLHRHQRCVGGSTERPITYDDMIHRMIRLGRGPA